MKANALRRGNVMMFNNAPHRVIDFHHHTPGNLRAMVQLKLRNLLTGLQTETKVASTEDIQEADVSSYKAQYLYRDGEGFHFMTTDSYEQYALSEDTLGDAIYYLQEQMAVDITFYNGNPIGVALPSTVILTVVDTEPEMKGATASNSPKPAKTETGLSLTVPAFVKIGDKIVVGTEEGNYMKRSEG
jgi:elongation factor P